jgi:enoyl-CoA hydratase/carnithine racemase
MNLRTIDWKIENDIGYLVLNQPPANTMTRLFFEELAYLTRHQLLRADFKALIVTGKGRHFSAGADHYDLRNRIMENLSPAFPDELPGFLKETTRSFLVIENLPVPTFAAIRGTCFGSALELALHCRYRICAEGTVLGFPEASFGLMPGCGGSVKLPSITGLAKAVELIVGGRNFSAAEAYEWGIVHKIVHRKTLLDETRNLALAMTDKHTAVWNR